jgi:hypothetical protein
MNRIEHLLTTLAEECVEVAQRATKALRFGLDEVQPGQKLTNAQRINVEVTDLFAVLEMLAAEKCGVRGCDDRWSDRLTISRKKEKVEVFLRYSAECGTLKEQT